jgi:hypothetical protein
LARREQRLAKLAEACAKIEARAKERFEQENRPRAPRGPIALNSKDFSSPR